MSPMLTLQLRVFTGTPATPGTGNLTAGADKRTIGTLLAHVLFFRKGRAPLRGAAFAGCSLCFSRSTFQDRNTCG